MIEEITPENISFTLPTVFDEELSFLEFCGKLSAKLNECIDGVNDNSEHINTIQEETVKNKESISALNTSVEALRTDKVDKVEGKGLSTNDYTDEDKAAVSAEQSRADNTFSNALKGSKSGGAFLIDDISPVTHEMGVKISSDTIEDLTAVKVRKQGKNLIPFPYYQELKIGTTTANGVDFTVYEDGSILINGTATRVTTRYLYKNTTNLLGLKSGITISGSKNASDDTQQGNVYFLCNYYNSTGTMAQGLVASNSPSGKITITDEWKGLGIYISVPNGKTFNNLLIKPQLEIGATATEYEPYITPTEYIPAADGTVNGVTSLYPNTTLTTDMDGISIDCKYNRDINKAFAALEAAAQNFLTNTEAGS